MALLYPANAHIPVTPQAALAIVTTSPVTTISAPLGEEGALVLLATFDAPGERELNAPPVSYLVASAPVYAYPVPFVKASSGSAAGGGSSTSAPRAIVYDLGTLEAGRSYDLAPYIEAIPPPTGEGSLADPLRPETIEITFNLASGAQQPEVRWPASLMWLNYEPGAVLDDMTLYGFSVRRVAGGVCLASLSYYKKLA